MLGILGDLVQHVEDLSSSSWFYVVIAVVAYLDSMIPIVPSETMVILGGVAAGTGGLWLRAGALSVPRAHTAAQGGRFPRRPPRVPAGPALRPPPPPRVLHQPEVAAPPRLGPPPAGGPRRRAARDGPVHPRWPDRGDVHVRP